MIRHDRTRQELPAPVTGGLLELTTDHLGLCAGQPDRITGQLVLGDATEVSPAVVARLTRLVVPARACRRRTSGLTNPRLVTEQQVPYAVQVKN